MPGKPSPFSILTYQCVLGTHLVYLADAIAAVNASINGKPYWDLTVSEALSTVRGLYQ